MDKTNEKHHLPSLLLVDDDNVLCSVLASALKRKQYKVTVAHDYQSALVAAAKDPPEYAVVDLKFLGGLGLCFITKLLALNARTLVVVLTGYASIGTAIEAVKLGAHFYLPKPANVDDIVAALRRDFLATSAPTPEEPLSLQSLVWEHMLRVLTENNGNISATARRLRMHRRTLQRKLSKHPALD